MAPTLNWEKIKQELNKITDVERLKGEVNKIKTEIKNLNLQAMLSPAAQERVKTFEVKYAEVLRTIGKAQRNIDREFNKVLRQLKTHRVVTEMNLEHVRKMAHEQKGRLQKKAVEIQKDLRKRFTKKSATAGKASGKKRRASKAATTKSEGHA